MELTFTAKTVSLLEKSSGMSITEIVQQGGITNYASLVQTGLGCSANEAFDKIDEFLKDKDIEDLGFLINGALQKAGFLSRDLPLEKMKKVAGGYYKDLNQALDNQDTEALQKAQVKANSEVEKIGQQIQEKQAKKN